MQLSDHFSLTEFTFSAEAERRGMANNPDPQALNNLYRLADTLETIRNTLGKPISVSSGYRTPALNAVTPGSSPTSAHMRGLAADIRVKGVSAYDLAVAIRGMGLPIDQVILEYDSWVHVGLHAGGDGKARREYLTKRTGTGYLPGLIPLGGQ